jgi:AcrR family transcriptional regulator
MPLPAWSKRPLEELDDGQRAAFERRRAQLLPAAATAVGRHGAAVTMADVAREAGVGMSTVYRTFASKDELLESLLVQRRERWLEIWERADGRSDPGPALIEALWAFVELERRERALASVLRELALGRRDLVVAVDRLARRTVIRAQEAGQLRRDVDYEDVVRVFHMLAAMPDGSGGNDWRRAMTVYLDGLLVGAAPASAAAAAASSGPVR